MQLAQEKGASISLTAAPLKQNDCYISTRTNSGIAIALWYGWFLPIYLSHVPAISQFQPSMHWTVPKGLFQRAGTICDMRHHCHSVSRSVPQCQHRTGDAALPRAYYQACLSYPWWQYEAWLLGIKSPSHCIIWQFTAPGLLGPTQKDEIEHMSSVSTKSSMVHSPLWFSVHQRERGRLPLCQRWWKWDKLKLTRPFTCKANILASAR